LLVLLVALVLWLMSGGVFGADPSFALRASSFAKATEDMMEGALRAEGEVAWKAWQQGIVIGFSFAAIIGATFAAALKVKRDDEAAMEQGMGETDEADESDPLNMPWKGMTSADARRIQVACAAEVRNVRRHVIIAKEAAEREYCLAGVVPPDQSRRRELLLELASARLERVACCLEALCEWELQAQRKTERMPVKPVAPSSVKEESL
jgi:hypothetical protein